MSELIDWITGTTETHNWLIAVMVAGLIAKKFAPSRWLAWRFEWRFFEDGRFCWRRIK